MSRLQSPDFKFGLPKSNSRERESTACVRKAAASVAQKARNREGMAVRLVSFALLGICAACGIARADEDIRGVWLTDGGKAQVRIASCGAGICGTVAHVFASPEGDLARDVHNPDPRLRARTVVGAEVLSHFRPDKKGAWTGGRVYDPEEGKSYAASLELQPNGSLKLTACLSVLCQSELWRRVK